MITALHTLVYADDPAAARDFFREVIGWPHVDTGGGWLIFKSGPSELGVHPTDGGPMKHEISLVCDDLDTTMRELEGRGGVFSRPARDDGWGITTELQVPGGPTLMLYQPRYDPPALHA